MKYLWAVNASDRLLMQELGNVDGSQVFQEFLEHTPEIGGAQSNEVEVSGYERLVLGRELAAISSQLAAHDGEISQTGTPDHDYKNLGEKVSAISALSSMLGAAREIYS